MRIDLGNFGNATREVVNTQVNRGDPTTMAQAKSSAAQGAAQQASRANQAWAQVGNTMQSIGSELAQQNHALAQQKAGLVIQQKELHGQGVMQKASDLIDQGQLKAADVDSFYQEGMKSFKYDDIDGLNESGRLMLEKGLQGVDMKLSTGVDHIKRQALKFETRSTVDEQIAANERLALQGSPDVSKAAAVYDSPVFQQNARIAYGPAAEQKIIAAKAGLWKASAMNQVLNNRESYSGLNALQSQITDPNGIYYGKLDAQDQLSLLGEIGTRKNGIETKAIAAQAHRDAVAAREQNRQIQAENHAMQAENQAMEFIAKGGVPSPQYLEQIGNSFKGTSLAGREKDIARSAADMVEFSKGSFADQQARLDAMAANMRTNGTTPEGIKQFNLLSSTLEASRKALKDDPITATATKAGQQVQPLDWHLLNTQGTWDQKREAMQAFATQLYQRKALNDQARQQDNTAPVSYLTADEKSQLTQLTSKMGPQEKADFFTNVQNFGGKLGGQLVKDMGGTDVEVAAAYHLSSNPNAPTGRAILEGQDLLNQKKGGFNAPPPKKTQAMIDEKYGNAIAPRQRGQLAQSVNAYYVAQQAKAGKDLTQFDPDAYEDALHAVVGVPIDFGASGQIIAPQGTDPNQFRESLYQKIKQLPDFENINANLQAGKMKLVPVSASTYMVVQPNGSAWISPSTRKAVTIGVQ